MTVSNIKMLKKYLLEKKDNTKQELSAAGITKTKLMNRTIVYDRDGVWLYLLSIPEIRDELVKRGIESLEQLEYGLYSQKISLNDKFKDYSLK